MRDAGMAAGPNATGNVVGRYDAHRPDAPALPLGSHIDTVRDAGRHDGNFGVVAAIGAVAVLHGEGRRLPRRGPCVEPTLRRPSAGSRAGVRPLRSPSGAGHDGSAIGALCPVGMLFVRYEDGISHNPAEAMTTGDANVAVRVLIDLLQTFDPLL